MTRRVLLLLCLVAVIAAGWIYRDSTAERRNADRIIAAIEKYRETHGKLPDPHDHEEMKRLGFELRAGWHPDFQVDQKGLYRITILEGFDGPYWIYDSFSQMWRRDFPQADTPTREVQTL